MRERPSFGGEQRWCRARGSADARRAADVSVHLAAARNRATGAIAGFIRSF
jgi:hypothetical protein